LGCLAICIWYEDLRTTPQLGTGSCCALSWWKSDRRFGRAKKVPLPFLGWRRIFPLQFGAFGPLVVRREHVSLGLGRRLRLLYASDLHLGHCWTRNVPVQLVDVCRQTKPDIILLGGDLADRQCGLVPLRDCVQALTDVAPVAAIPGNHDERPGIADVRSAVADGQGHWLPQRDIEQPLRIDAQIERATIPGCRVLCSHYPDVFPAAAKAGYRLVLAGHLHGGQCVLATFGGRLYPAAWFHRWHGLRFTCGGAILIVSRGVADTLPFRFNCPREVILCELS
jgi:predicted MPP superfamily phosphohydrolase